MTKKIVLGIAALAAAAMAFAVVRKRERQEPQRFGRTIRPPHSDGRHWAVKDGESDKFGDSGVA